MASKLSEDQPKDEEMAEQEVKDQVRKLLLARCANKLHKLTAEDSVIADENGTPDKKLDGKYVEP